MAFKKTKSEKNSGRDDPGVPSKLVPAALAIHADGVVDH